jgi:hypothetical protein
MRRLNLVIGLESSKEVCLDATPIPTINLNVLEQITNSKVLQVGGPFSFPLGMLSPNFENMCPPHFTLFSQLPLYCHFADPLDSIVLHYHCPDQVLQGRGLILRNGYMCLKRSLHLFMRSSHFNAS